MQDFCNDNILALKPLLDEVEDTQAIEERIIHFITISDILESLSDLINLKASDTAKPKKKTVKKKK